MDSIFYYCDLKYLRKMLKQQEQRRRNGFSSLISENTDVTLLGLRTSQYSLYEINVTGM